MKLRLKIIGFGLVSLSLFFLPERAFGAAVVWSDVSGGGVRNGLASSKKGNETNIAVSDSGKIFVAYQDKRERVFIKQYSDGRWSGLPGDGNLGYMARNGTNPYLETKGNNTYVAYTDLDGGRKARVRKWDGSSWSDLADANHALGYVSALGGFEPVLCFDKSGENLYAAFRDEAGGQRIKVMKWNDNSGWNDAQDANNPGGLISDSVASEVDIKASKNDNSIFAAFEDKNNGNKIRVKEWSGTSWSNLADANYPSGLVGSVAGYSPAIDLDNSGNIYLVYSGKKAKNTYIHKWNGSGWENIGDGLAVRGSTIESTVAVDQRDYIHIAYSQKTKGDWHIRTKVWNGSGWIETQSGKNKNISKGKGKGDPSLAAYGNKIFMSFTDSKNKNRARVKVLDFQP